MKHSTFDIERPTSNVWEGKAERVSFCSAANEVQGITIAGQTLVPNEDTAYVEFYMSHAFPVQTKYRTAIMPQVAANSAATLNHKVFNLAHLMRKYNPEQVSKDHILGTVVAVEFPPAPDVITCKCGCEFNWAAQPEVGMGSVKCPNCILTYTQPPYTIVTPPPGIRAVAAMHKAAENVMDILTSWFTGQNPYGGEWTVSMENSFFEEEGGFIVRGTQGMETFVEATPASLRALGFTYAPARTAPELLLACMNDDEDDRRDGIKSARVCRDFHGQEVIFLLGGLDGKIRYRGVGLTPADGAREKEARVSNMLASAPMIELDFAEGLKPLLEFGEGVMRAG